NGFTTVTISASDGSAATSTSFIVTVTGVNDPPVISSIPDQATDEDTRTAIIPFSISDLETPAAALVVTASSSDSLLLPQSSIALAGDGTNRTLTLLPSTNAYGNALITLRLTDPEGSSAQTTFRLTVNPVADLPEILTQPLSQTLPDGNDLVLS